MSIVWPHADDLIPDLKCGKMEIRPSISFSDENKVGTIKPHNDALMVTFRIWGYDVRRVLVDQGNMAEIMYLDLSKGLSYSPRLCLAMTPLC